MEIEAIFKVAAAIIASLGGAALLLAAFANWLGSIWAKRMLQNERAKHSELLEELKTELDLLKQKDITRHHDKIAVYKDIVHIVCEILRELEAVTIGKQTTINKEAENNFAINRTKAYGYIILISSQEVMDKYNEFIDFIIPVVYEGKKITWAEMREKADSMLNSMRKDLGITDEEITYKGAR